MDRVTGSYTEANFGTVGWILTFQKAKLVRILFASDLEYIQSTVISIKGRKSPKRHFLQECKASLLTSAKNRRKPLCWDKYS